MARFDGLVDTQMALKLTEHKQQVALNKARAQLQSLQEARQEELLRLGRQRVQLSDQLREARELTLQWVRVPGVGRGPAHLLTGVRAGGGAPDRHWAPLSVLVSALHNTWAFLEGG